METVDDLFTRNGWGKAVQEPKPETVEAKPEVVSEKPKKESK